MARRTLVCVGTAVAVAASVLAPGGWLSAANAESEPTAAAPAAGGWSPGVDVPGFRNRYITTVTGASRGSYSSTVNSQPVNYQAADGSWKPLDLSVKPVTGGFQPTASDLLPTLATIGSSPNLVKVAPEPGTSIAFGLTGALPVPGVTAGSTVAYRSLLPGVDGLFEVRPDGVKETLTLAGPGSPTTFDFPLHLRGLNAALADNGDISVTNAAGSVTAVMPHGSMKDSSVNPLSGEAASSDAVSYQLLDGPDGQVLHVSADASWLHDPARVFPVEVDPTTYVVGYRTSNDDSYAQSNGGGSSTDTVLKSGEVYGTTVVSRSFMHFGAVDYFRGRQINGATLHLYENYAPSCTARAVRLYPIASDWTESSAVYWPGPSLRGALSEQIMAHGYSGCAAADTAWDVKTAVNYWSTGGWPNYGLAIAATNEADTLAWKKWDSSEAAHPPTMNVNWTNSAPLAPGSLSVVPNDCSTCGTVNTRSTTPVLSAMSTDPDATPLQFDFEVYDSSGSSLLRSGSVGNISSGNTANWTVSSALSDGSYNYRVRAFDGDLYSAYSWWTPFTVDSAQPTPPTISSSSHPNPSVYYSAADIAAAWASSAVSGVAGYTRLLDQTSNTDPGTSSPTTQTSNVFTGKSDGCYFLHARALNSVGVWGSVTQRQMCLDTTLPTGPSNVNSLSHTINSPSNNTTLSMSVSGATDPLVNNSASGIAGFYYAFNTSPSVAADASQYAPGTSFSTSSNTLGDGSWYFHVRPIDNAGNVGNDVVRGPYMIDLVAPGSPTATSPNATSGSWTSASTVQFTWNTPGDVSGIAGYSVVLDTSSGSTPPASVSTTGTTQTFSSLADGSYYLHLRSVDRAGNWSTIPTVFALNVDSSIPVAPAVGSSTHPDQSAWSISALPTVTFSAGDLSGIAGFSYSLDQTSGSVPDATLEVTGASGSFTATTALPDGLNYFHVRALNGSGLLGDTATYLIRVDRSAPNVAPAPTSDHVTTGASNNPVLNFDWTNAPGSDVYSGVGGYSVTVNTNAATAADAVQDQTGTTYSYSAPSDGKYYFHIRALDRVGNITGDTVLGPYTIDLTVPGLTGITSSTHTQGAWSPNASGTFGFSASDLNGVAGYYAKLDETTSAPVAAATNTGSSWTTSGIGDGAHYVHALAQDIAGNWGPAGLYSIQVDSSPPLAPGITSSTHPSQSAWSASNAPGFSVSGSDTVSGLLGYSWIMDRATSTVPDATRELNTAGVGTASFSNVPDGLNYFHAAAVNGSGLLGAATTYVVKVDTTAPNVAPTVTSSSHQTNTPSNVTTLALGWTAAPGSDALSGVAGYSVAINNAANTLADSTLDQTGTSVSYSGLAEGSWYFHIRAIDAVGNFGPDTTIGPFVIDLTAPLAPAFTTGTHSQTVWSTNPVATCNWAAPSDPSGIAGYSVVVDQTAGTIPTTTINKTTPTWTTGTLPDGTSYVHVRARDLAGNWSLTNTFSLLVDTTAPAVPTITSTTHPTQGAWTTNNNPTFATTGTDVSGIAGYAYLLDQTPATIPAPTITTTGLSFTGLTDGQWYLHARAINGSGLPSLTSTYNISIDRAAPTAPTLTSLTHEPNVITNHRIATIDWANLPSADPLSGVAGYSVALNSDPLTAADATIDLTGTSYTTASLSDGTYWIHVRGIDSVGNAGSDSLFGPIAIDATHGFPYPVQDVLGTAGDGTATVTWAPVDDNGSPNLGYTVTADPGGNAVDVGASALSSTVSGLENNVAYSFTVVAHNANGTSTMSEPSLPVIPYGQSGAVQDLQADEVAPNGLHVQWLVGELNGNQDVTFAVTLSPGGATKTLHLSNDEGDGIGDPLERTDTTFTGLTPGTYTASVVATGTDGPSAAAVVSDPVIIRGDTPQAPTSMTSVAQDGQILLTWPSAVANGSAITQYEVVNEADGSTQYVDGTDTSTTMNDLTNGTVYTFDLYATNDLGRSLDFARASGTPSDSGVAAAVNATTPSNVRASTSGCPSCARVTWTAPAAAAPGVTNYKLTTYLASNNSPVGSATSTATNATVSGSSLGLPGTYGKQVYFKVATNTAAGTVPGTESNKSNNVTPGQAPNAPASLSAISGRSRITLTFPTPANNGNAIKDYRVQIYDGSTLIEERKVSSSPAKLTGGLTYGTNYTFTVKAENNFGLSAASPAKSALYRDAPLAPSSASATRSGTSLTVTWPASTERGEPVTRYVATLENSSQQPVTRLVSDPRAATFGGLRQGTTYRVDITVWSNVGRGGTRVSNDVLIAAPPGTPPNFAASTGPGRVDLRWSGAAPNGATVTGYDLYVDDQAGQVTLQPLGRDSRSKTVSGLAEGHAYLFKLYAKNSEGNSGSATATATPTGGSDAPPKPGHPSGDPGTGADLRTKISALAFKLSDHGSHPEREWPDGNCNWFTAQLGRAQKATTQDVSSDHQGAPCGTDPDPLVGSGATRSEEWCSDFSTWVIKQNGMTISGLDGYANSWMRWAKQRDPNNPSTYWHAVGSSYVPRVGDAAVWFTGSESSPGKGHVGLVAKVDRPTGNVWITSGNSGGTDLPDEKEASYKLYKNTTGDPNRPSYAPAGSINGQNKYFRGFAAPTV